MISNVRLTWSLVHNRIAATNLRFWHAGHQSRNLGEFGRGLAFRFGRGRRRRLLFFLDDRLDVPETRDNFCAATDTKKEVFVLQFSGFHNFGVRGGRVQLQRQLWNLYRNFLTVTSSFLLGYFNNNQNLQVWRSFSDTPTAFYELPMKMYQLSHLYFFLRRYLFRNTLTKCTFGCNYQFFLFSSIFKNYLSKTFLNFETICQCVTFAWNIFLN